MNTADYWINTLQLEKHPEGGYFKETYRSDELIESNALPNRYDKSHQFATSIYFLLKDDDFSAFHRLRSDEIWYFHTGSPLLLYIIYPDGTLQRHKIGLANDAKLQVTIPKNTYFAAHLEAKKAFALISCSVAPGFDFSDFELATRPTLLSQYPTHSQLITYLTN